MLDHRHSSRRCRLESRDTVDDRCHHHSGSVLWTIMTQWVLNMLFSVVQGGESGGTHDQKKHITGQTVLQNIVQLHIIHGVSYSDANHSQIPPLSQFKRVFFLPCPKPDSPSPTLSSKIVRYLFLYFYQTSLICISLHNNPF